MTSPQLYFNGSIYKSGLEIYANKIKFTKQFNALKNNIIIDYTAGGFILSLVSKISRALDVLMEDETVEKGNDFEKYVVSLFDENYFSISQWTSNITRKHDRFVESDCNPDLIMRYKPKNEVFCVECKYRSALYEGKLAWSSPNQLKRYQTFATENSFPFFAVIGLGGAPASPERMFCIPLREAKYPELFPSLFERFERDPVKRFFWKDKVLK